MREGDSETLKLLEKMFDEEPGFLLLLAAMLCAAVVGCTALVCEMLPRIL